MTLSVSKIYVKLRKIRELGKFPMAYSFFCHNFNTFAYKLNKLG